MPPRPADGRAPAALDGILVVDKPAGPTSHDVVDRVRRALRERRVGHTGTLDPLATGVLPLVLGRATRLAQFLSGGVKAYRAEVRLGLATDTYDALGTPIDGDAGRGGAAAGALPTPAAVAEALARFRGRFAQTPPAFSAKKVGGERAYALARTRRPVALVPVTVDVHGLELEAVVGDRVTLALEVSAGFYVRTLAHDLGQVLGCGAHLVSLRRTRSGAFDLSHAVGLEEVERDPGRVGSWLRPLGTVLRWLPGARLDEAVARRVAHGNAVRAEEVMQWEGPTEDDPRRWPGAAESAGEASLVRLLGPEGALLAVARLDGAGPGALLQPSVVLV